MQLIGLGISRETALNLRDYLLTKGLLGSKYENPSTKDTLSLLQNAYDTDEVSICDKIQFEDLINSNA